MREQAALSPNEGAPEPCRCPGRIFNMMCSQHPALTGRLHRQFVLLVFVTWQAQGPRCDAPRALMLLLLPLCLLHVHGQTRLPIPACEHRGIPGGGPRNWHSRVPALGLPPPLDLPVSTQRIQLRHLHPRSRARAHMEHASNSAGPATGTASRPHVEGGA